MDRGGFRMNGLLWDVTISGVNWERVYLTSAYQVCNIEESFQSANWISPDPTIPQQYKAISISLCVSLGHCLVLLTSLFRLIFSFLSLNLCFCLILELCWNDESSFVWRASQFLITICFSDMKSSSNLVIFIHSNRAGFSPAPGSPGSCLMIHVSLSCRVSLLRECCKFTVDLTCDIYTSYTRATLWMYAAENNGIQCMLMDVYICAHMFCL